MNYKKRKKDIKLYFKIEKNVTYVAFFLCCSIN